MSLGLVPHTKWKRWRGWRKGSKNTPTWQEGTNGWRNLHNEDFHNLLLH